METLDFIWKEIQNYEKANNVIASEKLYNLLDSQVDHIKGPLKYEVCLTKQCNQHCLHCSNGLIYKPDQFDRERLKIILAQEPLIVVLTGGEPLLHPDFFSIVSEIKKHGTFLKICTNGLELTDRACELLGCLEKYDVVQISLDATDKETYACIRGSYDFENVLKNIQTFRHAFPDTTLELHCVPNRFNYLKIPQIYSLAKELGANVFSTAPLAYLGRAKQEYQADVVALLQMECDLYRNSDNRTRYIGCLFEISSLCGKIQNPGFLPMHKGNMYRCAAGLTVMYIDCNEDVYPCVYLQDEFFRLGNLKDGLQTLIEQAKARYKNGIPIKGTACESCALWGSCNGGCMGVAYAFSGKTTPGLDPRCGRFNKDR